MDNYQTVLFPYAYNILGSAADAEDAVQEVILRFTAMDKSSVGNEKNYLIKSVINQSIKVKQHNSKVVSLEDVWLPEPVITEDFKTNILFKDIASYSLLANLEFLKAKERAVLILKEGFNYSHQDIAEFLSISVDNSKKILSRAKERLKALNFDLKEEMGTASSATVKLLIAAIQNNNTEEVENLLAQDVRMTADGGKHVNVLAKICDGRSDVAKLLVKVYNTFNHTLSIVFTEINHQPSIIYLKGKRVKSCQIFHIKNGLIQRVDSVIDPLKLKNLEIYLK